MKLKGVCQSPSFTPDESEYKLTKQIAAQR